MEEPPMPIEDIMDVAFSPNTELLALVIACISTPICSITISCISSSVSE